MKILLSWLEQYVDGQIDWPIIFDKLTQSGLEIESITKIAPDFSGVVVGEVLEKNKHPNADKLNVCKVKTSEEEVLEIVCGANNVEVGIKVPCAKLGAVLPNNFVITERKMRGITSYGMLCSGSELGIVDNVDGLLLLSKDALIGQNVRDYLKLDDKIVELKITPNRGDCLSIQGILREIKLITNNVVNNINYGDILTPILNRKYENIAINNRYILKLNNINNHLNLPDFILDRISASGIQSVNTITDILNYVMLETGQPFFVYDGSKISDVKTEISQYQIITIDNRELKLDDKTLITTSNNKVIGITGVNVLNDFTINDNSTQLFIEALAVNPEYLAGIAKKYNIVSNLAYRYERGVDPKNSLLALSYVYNLICKYIPEVVLESCEGYNNNFDNQHNIELSYSYIKRILGIDINKNQIKDILLGIGSEIINEDDENLLIKTPSYRFDLCLAIDLIEEIARIYSYDRINTLDLEQNYVLKNLDNQFKKINFIKNNLVLSGYTECINYAFIEDKYNAINQDLSNIEAIKLQNSIAGLNNMRTSLIGGLIKSMQYNINRGHKSIKLFEVAKVFYQELPNFQPQKVAGLCYGIKGSNNWHNNIKTEFDFYDIKADVENLLLPLIGIKFEQVNNINLLHPGRCAKILHYDIEIGIIGQLHPVYLQSLDLNMLPYIFELDLDYIIQQKKIIKVKIPLKFQKVERDLAVVVDKNMNAANIIDFIYQLNINNLINCSIFDVYTGSNLEEGKKNIAVNLIFQANKTLTDEEINQDFNFIIDKVIKKFNIRLR
jgi:phenylalanyl-tRNA synthetase beta chain